ncbi:hypothetical protein A0J61_11267 [Choanephora cucurbitarum]|uniref:Uncharacterized protein n=1 Tax=Choanephora cucurbitarum TaxID=101091 RepID=A0A1C7MZZ7_9FUNG|nr:hypothetical protein A0J61_11267 [Choanephora cucurbitarum]
MKAEKKWKVKGTYVEDILYEFGLQHKHEDASHSFILNVRDELLAAKFSADEWKAILTDNSPKIPRLPDSINKELELIKAESMQSIRQFAAKKLPDVVNDDSLRTMYTCLLMMVDIKLSGFFDEENLEDDIKSNLWWPLLDYVFLQTPELLCRRGESSCVASAKRKRLQDLAGKRKSIGRKADLRVISRVDRLELGYGEGSRTDDVDSAKNVYDSCMKTAKCLKDMLLCLLVDVKYDPDVASQIVIVGFQFSKYKMKLLFMNNAGGYTCRIKETKYMTFLASDDSFLESFVAIYKLLYVAKMTMLETLRLVKQSKSKQELLDDLFEEEEYEEIPSGMKTPVQDTTTTSSSMSKRHRSQ